MSKSFNNYVAKHMHTFNRPSVELDKRDKLLDDLYEQELDEQINEDVEDENRH